MMALGWSINLMQRGKASLDRIKHILDQGQTKKQPEYPKYLPQETPDLLFQDVNFSYFSNSREVLRRINLKICSGQTVGIVGPPGSGKTTLLNLIPRLYDPTQGRILLDHIDLREFAIFELRSLITFVSQDPFLFAGTIRDNIEFVKSGALEEELLKAAKNADFLETIRSMPNGLDTFIGEKGITLSGGQKQRLSLTRAFLVKSRLLLLDDPVSQVDTQTAENIIGKLTELQGEQTMIIVSHRLAPLVTADKIVSLREGEIIEQGSHRELVEQNGYYARSYRLQKIEQDLYDI